MKNLLKTALDIILKLFSSINSQLDDPTTSIKDKKIIAETLSKLVLMILRLEKMPNLDEKTNMDENDLKIISSFLEKNQKMVAREGFEPPTNGL